MAVSARGTHRKRSGAGVHGNARLTESKDGAIKQRPQTILVKYKNRDYTIRLTPSQGWIAAEVKEVPEIHTQERTTSGALAMVFAAIDEIADGYAGKVRFQ